MNLTFGNVLNFLQLVALLITLWSFFRSRREDMRASIAREEKLDNAIVNLSNTVSRLESVFEVEAAKTANMEMLLRLLIQQHQMNHNQHINGGNPL